MHYTNVLFDLDGTLTDPKLGITKSVQYALQRMGIAVDDLDQLEPFIGPPLMQSFQELYSFSNEQAQQAIGYYREYFSELGIYENELYDGIKELLVQLRLEEKVLYVATSKPTVFAERILRYFDIDSYFRFVCGSNLDGTRSAKGEIIEHIVKEQNLEVGRTVMIGDRKHDIIGANLNHMQSVGVEFGYGSKQELETAGAAHIVETVNELRRLLCSASS